jgi:predicted outer membrane repeat protein
VRKKLDRSLLAFLFSSAILLFGYGVAVGSLQIFPFGIIKYAIDSVQVVWRFRSTILQTRPQEFLQAARFEGDGVTRYDEERMALGLTLISGFFEDTNEIRLIGHDGELVNRWPVRFSEIFPETTHIQPVSEIPANDWGTDIHGALALPDGSVVFNFEYMGMAKLDRCGSVQWTIPRMTHHSIDFSNDGNFWVGGRDYVEGPRKFPPLSPPYLEDKILKVSPAGEILAEISVPELLFRNGLQYLLTATGQFSVKDRAHLEIVHLNDIEELRPELAERFPLFAAGDLVLSFRHLNLLVVVNPDSMAIKWHRTGPYIRQHDPDFLPDGTISVFDNNSDGSGGGIFGGSRILEIDPSRVEVVVRYGADPGQEMYTEVRGKHQNLWNGNILITESLGGRVFEVTDAGTIVWEFINRYDEDAVARLSDAIRYPEGYFSVTNWDCR